MRVLQALGLLAQASNLSDFCRLADTKRFQSDIKLLTLQVQVQQLDNAKVLPALTAALVKGLQLYVSTSTQHISQAEDAKHNFDQTPRAGSSSSGTNKPLLQGQQVSAATEGVQESLEHLSNLAGVLGQSIASYPRSTKEEVLKNGMHAVVSCLLCHEAGARVRVCFCCCGCPWACSSPTSWHAVA